MHSSRMNVNLMLVRCSRLHPGCRQDGHGHQAARHVTTQANVRVDGSPKVISIVSPARPARLIDHAQLDELGLDLQRHLMQIPVEYHIAGVTLQQASGFHVFDWVLQKISARTWSA